LLHINNKSKIKIMETYLYSIKKNQSEFPRQKISSSKDAEQFIRQFYGDDLQVYESFFLLLLNQANETVGYAKISQGGIAGTVVDVKIIAKYVVDTLSQAVVLAHNHPSGNIRPSQADENMTTRIKATLNLFDCKVLDHIILTADNYFSFQDNGLI
jgi:DNA repair protein RadC